MATDAREQKRPLLRWAQTRTTVLDEPAELRSRARGLRLACRATACAMLVSQLWLWTMLKAYPLAGRAAWQAALLQALPIAALWLLWRGYDASRAPGVWEKGALLLLLPCLMWDAGEALRGLCALCETALLPTWPRWLTAGVLAALCWLSYRLSGDNGAVLGISALKWLLLALILLSTALLGARPRIVCLWPLGGEGVRGTARAALGGVGGGWIAALMFVLPREATVGYARRRIGAPPRKRPWPLRAKRRPPAPPAPTVGGRALPWLGAALGLGLLLPLWAGLCAPQREALTEGQRLLSILWLSDSPALYQLGTVCWLMLLLCALVGGAWYAEHAAQLLAPKLPRSLAAGVLAAVALAAALLAGPSADVWHAVAPYRAALAAAGGALTLIGGRRST